MCLKGHSVHGVEAAEGVASGSGRHLHLRLRQLFKILKHTTFETSFYVSKMDPASQTHCVLLLDLPPSALAGIDLLSFTTTPRFRGVKNVPPGLHFAFAASDSSVAVRHGAWFYVSPGSGAPQVFVKKWDAATEDFVAEPSPTEVLRWKANLGSIWKDGLTPYRQTVSSTDTGEEDVQEESTDWDQLTSRITPSLLSRITGLNPDHWSLTSASSASQDLEHIPGLELSNSVIHPEKELHFLPIDLKRPWREGATDRERSEAAQDRSWALGDFIENYCSGENVHLRESEVLGELQFAFLMVLTLNNNSCLEQWSRLLGLLLTCRAAVKERAPLFQELLKTLRLQLSHCGDMEAGMFDLNEHGGGFLKPLLRKFRRTLDDFDGKWKSDMVDEFDELQDFLNKTFGWELDGFYVKRGWLELEDGERVEMDVNDADADDELGEYAPVVVELTPAQRKELFGTVGSGTEDSSSEDDAELEDMDTRY
ncbi:AAR2 protein-domain-containing protein [Massariosphaeria phaeospora]|uniref:AAR2 protein-domain-containing protein n=1 Tax=Massariosphaeria phaeospora TaxID=100035 RepID=A0A7C8M1J0_9PLEO|nr:AAR2 protein-domain-containing protein [Massariosphaeria phaeospora]